MERRKHLHKESSVRIEGCLYQFGQKLAEHTATIDADLFQSDAVDHLYAEPRTKIGF